MRAAASVTGGYRSWLVWPRLGLLTALRARLRRIGDRWARSLQLRVIAATLMLSAIVVSVLGYVLMQHLVTELYNDKVQSSVNIVDVGLGGGAASSAEFSGRPTQGSRQDMVTLAHQLASTGETPYALEITLPPAYQGPQVFSAGAAVGLLRFAAAAAPGSGLEGQGRAGQPPVPARVLDEHGACR